MYDAIAWGLKHNMIGVFSIDMSKSYMETLFFFVEKLKQVLELVKDKPAKQSSVSGLRRIIDEYSKELQVNWSVLENEEFKKKALKNMNDADLQNTNLRRSIAPMSTDPLKSSLTGSKIVPNSDTNIVVVKYPVYAKDEQGNDNIHSEMSLPDPTKYVDLGFDSKNKKSRHYRYIENRPLESTDFIMCSVFDAIDIKVGKQLKVDQSFWDRMISSSMKEHTVGSYKGSISVYKQRAIADLQNLDLSEELTKMDLPSSLKNWTFSNQDKDIMTEVEVRVRLYLIEAQMSESLDIGSESDIYTIIYLGTKKLYNNKDKRINDRNDPKFFSSFEFKAVFPGPSMLKIEFWDYDPIGGDEFIGSTEMDLETRFFDKKWSTTVEHPIENRKISKNELTRSAGSVKLWVEIDRVSDSLRMQRPLLDISPVPPMNFEFRVIVWEANNVPLLDPEGLGDIYISCAFPSLSNL